MHSSSNLLHQNFIPKPPSPTPQIPLFSPCPPNPVPRRDFVSLSSLLLIISPHTSQTLRGETLTLKLIPSPNCTDEYPITEHAFLDVSISGEPIGRIIIGLYGKTVVSGTSRFTSLVTGTAGVSYRKIEFIKIMPNYIQHGRLRSYGVDVERAKKTGSSNLDLDRLVYEWEDQEERCHGVKNVAKIVSLIVRDPLKPEPKIKLVARKGKLEIDQEEVGTDPNGMEFVISMKDSSDWMVRVWLWGELLKE